MASSQKLYDALDGLGTVVGEPLPVTLSPELIGLLSEQLYRSPSKAIEELVVNGFDAEADECRVFVPKSGSDVSFVVVYDDGRGMSYEGLADLWKVGRAKERDETVFQRKLRKQIGKFGIGKLATHAVAHRVTYITKTDSQHLAVKVDYRDFTAEQTTNTTSISLPVRNVGDFEQLWNEESFQAAAEAVELEKSQLEERPSWTMVILDDLKAKARLLSNRRLRSVLSTAMPLSTGFTLYLNGDEVPSSKEEYETIVHFDIADLPPDRLEALKNTTKMEWKSEKGALVAPTFPEGIRGSARVTKASLRGKSTDLMRSEGFFVYVRERLVNLEDARFGLHTLSHATWNRFRAEIQADDLDAILTANRESLEDVDLYEHAQAVLLETFNEARRRYEETLDTKTPLDKREDTRNWVAERLVEQPTADALTSYGADLKGAEPDESWMYLTITPDTDVKSLTSSLYQSPRAERSYKYVYSSRGTTGRLVTFEPLEDIFTLNWDHELVLAYADEPASERLLQVLATGEAMLEVYLREAGVPAYVIGEVLEKRDLLFRGLANDRMFSLEHLSRYIRESADESTDLEIAVVAGARALGFVAKHVSGSGEPDGIARFADFPNGEQTITLEAKSSRDVPSAKDIDFAAIELHMQKHGARGCLLVAPGYPGDESGNAAQSARNAQVSCWTVDQFAKVISAAESRKLSARWVLEVIRKYFAPQDVEKAVNRLLEEPTWESRSLYLAIVDALHETREKLTDSQRNVTMIATHIASKPSFENIKHGEVLQAASDISGASQGGLVLLDNETIVLNVEYEEIKRRVESLIGSGGTPRRKGTFSENAN